MEKTLEKSTWTLRDEQYLWHPFSRQTLDHAPTTIVKGSGAYVFDENGNALLDAISSWWVNLHGHTHPAIIESIYQQAQKLEHVIFAEYTHPQAIILAEKLVKILPKGLKRVFYSDNGSTAVETAVKIALQYQGNEKKILAFENGYHGDTFGAMSVAGKNHYNAPFWPYLFEVFKIPPPYQNQEQISWKAFENIVESEEIAAFIFEPLLQGPGGMRSYAMNVLSQMVRRCQEKGILTIADEVMTGFGRTGPLFACEFLDTTPDLLCLSKGLTGGFLPLGATIAKEYLYQAFFAGDGTKNFLHGHSYCGNPLACAAASASIDLLLTEQCAASRRMIEEWHADFKMRLEAHPKILRCEVVGTVLVLEYSNDECSYYSPLKQRLTSFFKSHGVLIRPLGNVLYILPPYCIKTEELNKIYTLIERTLEWI